MVFLFFLIMIGSSAFGMEQDDPFLLTRKDIMHADVQSALCRIKPGLEVNRQDASGTYLLHWAVLKSMQKTNSDWRATMDARMQVVKELLLHGADYTAQERDSKNTIFHILAYHLSPDSKDVVSYAFDQVLRSIARREIKGDEGHTCLEQTFIERVQKVYNQKDAREQSVVDIVSAKKGVDLVDIARIKNAYKLAIGREVICY